jgi:hypothetical protein
LASRLPFQNRQILSELGWDAKKKSCCIAKDGRLFCLPGAFHGKNVQDLNILSAAGGCGYGAVRSCIERMTQGYLSSKISVLMILLLKIPIDRNTGRFSDFW